MNNYIRIDDFVLLDFPELNNWLGSQPDAEYRDDYCSWFVPVGSRTHTWLAVTYPEVLKYSV